MKPVEVLLFTSELADLIEAGMTLGQALQALSNQGEEDSAQRYVGQDLCDRIAFINHGTLLKDDDISAFESHNGTRNFVAKVDGMPTDEAIQQIDDLDYVITAYRQGNDIVVSMDSDASLRARLYKELADMNIQCYGLVEEDALEETYLDLIKESR